MLATAIGNLHFDSLLLNASGTFNPTLFSQLFPFPGTLGGVVTKTVTPMPRGGNPQHRTVELPGIGMLNSIGLQNPGLEKTLAQGLPDLASHKVPIILSLSGNSVDEFVQMAQTIQQHPNGPLIQALELNLSCPNIQEGGIHFGVDPVMVKDVVTAMVESASCPVFAKLTPNVMDITAIAQGAVEGGAHALVAINTVMGSAIDLKRKTTALAMGSGGYSGPGIKPVALHALLQLHRAFPDTPLIGVGGVACTNDVLEFLMAGATMVQVGTSCYRMPTVFKTMADELTAYGKQEGLSSLRELIGCANPIKAKI